MNLAKPKQSIRLKNSKYKTPKEFVSIIKDIKKLEFVVSVGAQSFRASRRKKEIKIVGFDELRQSYVINMFGKKYEQKLFVKVDRRKKEYEEIIKKLFYINLNQVFH